VALKIFIIGPAYPLRGGPAQFNENLCAELIKAGHDAQIISYSLQYPSFLFPGSSQLEQGGTAPAGIRVHTLINTINPLTWRRTARFIRREKPDFILIRYWLPFFGPSLGSIARMVRKRTKVLALTDNVIPHEKRLGDTLFTRFFLRGCDGFITMSRTVLNDLGKFTGNPHRTYHPHPMYETYGPAVAKRAAREKLGLPHDARIVLFFGLVRHYKGLDLLMEAVADPSMKDQQITLLIAGEFYEDKAMYDTLIRKLGIQDKVIIHDRFISNSDVRWYFSAADITAQTYRHATNSGVTMVAFYYDKPVLVTNVGGLAEIVSHNHCGYVVERTAREIAAALIDFYSNNREPGFIANVKEEKKKYEWSEFISSLLKLYREVSGHNKSN
jgi:D-inositol-3-phosphate glycosyltransferase